MSQNRIKRPGPVEPQPPASGAWEDADVSLDTDLLPLEETPKKAKPGVRKERKERKEQSEYSCEAKPDYASGSGYPQQGYMYAPPVYFPPPPQTPPPPPKVDESSPTSGLWAMIRLFTEHTPDTVKRWVGVGVSLLLLLAISQFVLQINYGATINRMIDRQHHLTGAQLESIKNNTNTLNSIQERLDTLHKQTADTEKKLDKGIEDTRTLFRWACSFKDPPESCNQIYKLPAPATAQSAPDVSRPVEGTSVVITPNEPVGSIPAQPITPPASGIGKSKFKKP